MVGLAAIIIFGGGMIFRMTQPSEREIMERRLASLPTISAPTMEFPMPDLSSTNPTVTPPDLALAWLTVYLPGGRARRSCRRIAGREGRSLLLGRAWRGVRRQDCREVRSEGILKRTRDNITPLMDMQKKLDTAGIAKLKAEGLTDGGNWANFTLPYGDKAEADYKANALRIPVATCMERASELPPGTLY